MIGNILLLCAAAGLLTSTVFLLLVILAAHRFRHARRPPVVSDPAKLPPVSILKPLHGLEPQLEENLESFFRQNYPCFEVIFGARDASDPALQVVQSLQTRYPQIKSDIVVSGEPPWPNAKVFALEKMMAQASYETVVISDSDVRVEEDCLARVIPPLLDLRIGMVTCIYRGVPSGGLWSRLEALGMSVEMSSGVLVAEMLEGMKFALGPLMATRKPVLEKVGGFAALRDYCADDFVLGHLVDAAGMKVKLSNFVIEHVVLNRSARQSLLHQVRWMKSSRTSRPLGHLGTGLTFAMPFGLLGLAAGWWLGNWTLGWMLLAVALLNRIVQALVVGWGSVRDRRSLDFCWLYPARDLLGFLLWCASFLDREIVWRGDRYRLTGGGKMIPRSRQSAAPAEQEDAVPRRS
jgi:ceramide glucosyltransferase